MPLRGFLIFSSSDNGVKPSFSAANSTSSESNEIAQTAHGKLTKCVSSCSRSGLPLKASVSFASSAG